MRTFPLVLVMLIGCTPRPELPDKIELGDTAVLSEQVDWLAQDAVKGGGSMVVGVYASGERLHFSAAGELADGDRPDHQTRFRAGSISKLFTALAVLRLHEEGALDIDAPLADQLPEFSIQSRFEGSVSITPRHVLSHHAGLPSDHLPGMFSDDAPDFTKHAAALADEYVTHPPGEWWSYSNLGYALLGHLVEEASGQTFEDYIAHNFFEPCRMERSSWRFDDSVTGTINGEPASEGDSISVTPAGALVTTVEDLSRFARGLIEGGACPDGQLLSVELLHEAWSPSDYSPMDLGFTWGLGFVVIEGPDWLNGERVVGHTGSTLLFSSQILIAPELGLTAIAMSNEAGRAEQVTHVALEGMRLATEILGNPRPAPLPDPTDESGPSPFTEQQLKAYEGVYGTLVDAMEVRREGDGLATRVQGNDVRMVPTQRGTFLLRPKVGFLVLPIDVAKLEFVFEEVDGTMVMGTRGDLTTMTWMPFGTRFDPVDAEGAWAGRLGSWTPTNGTDDYFRISELRLTDEPGFLALSMDKVSPIGTDQVSKGLLPVDDNQAIIAGSAREAGETLRIEQTDQGEVIHYLGYTFERQPDSGCLGCSAAPRSSGWEECLLVLAALCLVRRQRAGTV